MGLRHGTRHHRARVDSADDHWSPSRHMAELSSASSPTMASSPPAPSVFVSGQNGTLVRAHIGSTAVLSCKVVKGSQYGMVS